MIEINDYWFALKSHVYVKFGTKSMFLYDTNTGNTAETSLQEAVWLVKQTYEPKNMGVALLDKNILKKENINNFVIEVLEKSMGDITETTSKKPIRLIPILNLQRDIEKLIKNDPQSVMQDVNNYLFHLNVYINDCCNIGCHACNNYYKQGMCCTANNEAKELSFENIVNLLEQVEHTTIARLSILGGNILVYDKINELYNILSSYKEKLHFHIHYKNWKNSSFLQIGKLNLLIDFPINNTILSNVLTNINLKNTIVKFIIESDDMYHEAEKIIEKYNIEITEFIPFFNESNGDFFKENVFIRKEDIFSPILNMREIFRNQKLNSNFFGKLYVFPNGNIKANTCTKPLGNIKDNTVLNLIGKEMLENTAWRQIRDKEPCKDCSYQFICPAPSNYETVIGKPNLCHVKP